MTLLVVVDQPADWPLDFDGVQLVGAHDYLSQSESWPGRGVTVFNLCQSYQYQSLGWYVSLLAAARGHRPIPTVATLRDIGGHSLIQTIPEDLDRIVQRSLAPIQGDSFTLSVYFGRNLAERHARLARQLYNLYQVPFLRARFVRREGHWDLISIQPIAAQKIPASHRPFVLESAGTYFARKRFGVKERQPTRYDLAILHDPAEESPPSDERAIAAFRRAAAALDIGTAVLDRDDYGRLAEYDGLFIRVTTGVNHYTYDFARRAEKLGLVVMDDPQSILQCTNKVFLAELLQRHGIAHPATLLMGPRDVGRVEATIGLPCILKQPDSAFSMGVVKVETPQELERQAGELLQNSELIIAQQFIPTEFDWRVGVLDRRPLFVCQYHMARRHWQIIKRDDTGKESYGRVTPIPVEEAPEIVVQTAVKAANLIGDGLYGVDLKTTGRHCYVIEVNDNPNLEAGYEDMLLGDRLYADIMAVFLHRIEERKSERNRRVVGEPTTREAAS